MKAGLLSSAFFILFSDNFGKEFFFMRGDRIKEEQTMAKLLDITEKQKRDVRHFNVSEEDQSEFDRGIMKMAREKLFKRDKALMDELLKKDGDQSTA